MSRKLKKNTYMGPYFSIVPLIGYFKDCVMITMFDFGIFCHLLRLMGIYRVGAPVRIFEKFRSLFYILSAFFSFLFYSSFSFFLSFFFLSLGGPFSSGAPGHCPPMPPSRYATENRGLQTKITHNPP